MNRSITCALFAFLGIISDFGINDAKSNHFIVKDANDKHHLLEIEAQEDGKRQRIKC